MEWSEECRIKHLPTGKYLAVTENDYKVNYDGLDSPFLACYELQSDFTSDILLIIR